ncbi:MAG: response regulator [Elusimicrobiota bacterium]|nr:response regulator [Elusimicrobiota bacterium]
MRHKVVIVDDDAAIRSLFENAFSGICQLFAAAEGQAALELIKGEKPDLVFLDIDMPGVSGLEVLRLMKESGAVSIVWMLTGNEKLEIITEAISLGAAGYLTKPFEVARIRGILDSVSMPGTGKRSAKPWRVKRKN